MAKDFSADGVPEEWHEALSGEKRKATSNHKTSMFVCYLFIALMIVCLLAFVVPSVLGDRPSNLQIFAWFGGMIFSAIGAFVAIIFAEKYAAKAGIPF